MRLIVIREMHNGGGGTPGSLLRYALSTPPLAEVVRDGLRHLWCGQRARCLARWVGWTEPSRAWWAVPQAWQGGLAAGTGKMSFYTDTPRIDLQGLEDRRRHPWIVISDGRFATRTNCELLAQMLAAASGDVVAVTAASDLLAYRERVRLTRGGELVGYRRLYADTAASLPLPSDWPHHLFVRTPAAERLFRDGLPARFAALVDTCRAHELGLQSFAVAGTALDLESEDGLLALCQVAFGHAPGPDVDATGRAPCVPVASTEGALSPRARLIGPVLLGKGVMIEADAVVVGPSVLCERSVVQKGAVVDTVVLGADTIVAAGQVIRNRVVATACAARADERGVEAGAGASMRTPDGLQRDTVFREWPRFSYARCFKRAADFLAALLVLVLFLPVMPFLALAVKLSSPGPVFFRDKRQGLHGRVFHCIKFRTMREGADKMQEKLRFACEVDGPQFKMADDPRITTVGRFLRETYLDEIPQFWNVLCGQMSVVGPRPSPEAENTLCPLWRDARLSVRPGITGLWQVCRTREAHKDFQEWIRYDTQYVREFSPHLDLWICWRTLRRMVENFISQF